MRAEARVLPSCRPSLLACPSRASIRASGAEGSRTPDLLNAIQALSQLSYGPNAYDVAVSNSPFLRRRREKH